MNVAIVYDSRTRNTENAAHQIASAFRAAGIEEARVFGVREADAASVATADWICIGSWTQGLFVLGQHPTTAILDFVGALPDLSGKSALVFCSYALARGGTLARLAEALEHRGAHVRWRLPFRRRSALPPWDAFVFSLRNLHRDPAAAEDGAD